MKKIKSQKGQALVLIALAAIGLVAITALAVDGGRVYSDRRNAQNAADTAVLAAALAKIHGDDFITIAKYRAASNGYDGGDTNDVNVYNPPISGPYAGNSDYIQVIISSTVQTTFARVIGRNQLTNVVEAIARAQEDTPPLGSFPGAGLVSVKDSTDKCFKVNGNADLTIHDAGVFVNCTGADSLFFNGTADIGMDADAQVAGCANDKNFPIGAGKVDCGVAQQIITKSTFKDYPTTKPTPSCDTAGSKTGDTYSPGYFSGSVNITTTVTFTPGTYCFDAGLSVKAGGNIQGTDGPVQLVLSDDLTLNGSANDFSDLEVYVNGTTFKVGNSGTLTADRFRFFGLGNATFSVQGGTFSSNDVYLYSKSGVIDINAQADVNMHAPPSGDTFGGILIYMPWGNTNSFELNGGVNNTWTGLVLMPTADVTYNGGAGFELHGQVIASTFIINGGGSSDIYYESTLDDPQQNDPTIEFTQ